MNFFGFKFTASGGVSEFGGAYRNLDRNPAVELGQLYHRQVLVDQRIYAHRGLQSGRLNRRQTPQIIDLKFPSPRPANVGAARPPSRARSTV